MKRSPWTFTAKAPGTLEIQMYDYIGEDDLGGISAAAFADQLKAAGDVSKIHLSSPW
jgi:hypothetical protein